MSSSSTSTPKKMISLRSSDGERFDMEENAASVSKTLKNMIEDDCADDIIPMPRVNAKCLAVVIEYCKAQVELQSDDERKKFSDELVQQHDVNGMFELILAANYLDIRGLLDVLCQGVADKIKDYSVEHVRDTFGVENDYTQEGEAALRQENAWAFD